LKTWFTLKTYGADKIGSVIERSCALARYLEGRVRADPRLELLAPVQLNIVCFRYRAADANAVNAEIVADIHESGIAAPSTTMIEGHLAIRRWSIIVPISPTLMRCWLPSSSSAQRAPPIRTD
jgi:glutamate/tyrosine decarboxylase-like PLP-dependent enzyme